MIKTRDGFWVAAALAIAVGACSKSKAAAGGGGGAAGGAPPGVPPLGVVGPLDTPRGENSPHRPIANPQSIDLPPPVGGRIAAIPVPEGREGEPTAARL